MKNSELSLIPPERHHTKSETWWLAERGSPAIYLGNQGLLTDNVWEAKRFPSSELAQEYINSCSNCYGTDWRVLDHIFYT